MVRNGCICETNRLKYLSMEKDAAHDELLNNHPSGNSVELHDDKEYYEEVFQEGCEEKS